jgi:hypothetical protein
MITAAGSKYTGASAPMVRNDAGIAWRKIRAKTLYRYAEPVPSPISVNMLRLRFRTDAQARSKKGQPLHSTTGVANTNCTQRDTAIPSK